MNNIKTWKCNTDRGKETVWILFQWLRLGPCLSHDLLLYHLLMYNFILQCFIHLSACLSHWTGICLRDCMRLAVLSPVTNMQGGRTQFPCYFFLAREEQECLVSSSEEKNLGGTPDASSSPPPLLSGLLISLGDAEEEVPQPHLPLLWALLSSGCRILCHDSRVSIWGRLGGEGVTLFSQSWVNKSGRLVIFGLPFFFPWSFSVIPSTTQSLW